MTEFAVQFSVGTGIILIGCVLGLRPWASLPTPLAFVFSLSGFINILRAVAKGVRPGGPTLNHWDSALAFNGCTFLIHGLAGHPG